LTLIFVKYIIFLAKLKEVFMLTAIVGINWGDEGKGRMVDLLAADYDAVIREATTRVIQLSMNQANLYLTCFHQVF